MSTCKECDHWNEKGCCTFFSKSTIGGLVRTCKEFTSILKKKKKTQEKEKKDLKVEKSSESSKTPVEETNVLNSSMINKIEDGDNKTVIIS